MCLTATLSREVTQTLASATSKEGLNREAWAALLSEPKLWDSQRERKK